MLKKTAEIVVRERLKHTLYEKPDKRTTHGKNVQTSNTVQSTFSQMFDPGFCVFPCTYTLHHFMFQFIAIF